MVLTLSPEMLGRQFTGLWSARGMSGDGRARFDELRLRYEEPHRKYHTLGHIGACIPLLLDHRTLAKDFGAVLMALMYHDAVYQVPASHGQNEEGSAEFARQIFLAADKPDFGMTVAELIRATKHDGTSVSTDDARLTADIDLSSLGFDPDRFDADGRKIREEYKSVPDEIFFAKQREILKAFLDRGRIYYTDAFQDRFGAQAKTNLQRAIAV